MKHIKISIYILSLFILTYVQSYAQSNPNPTRMSHLLDFQIGSSLDDVSLIITNQLNHTLSSSREKPYTLSEWCIIDLRKEGENQKRKDIWENNGVFQPDLKLISKGHPQLPAADEVILEFMDNKLEYILVRIPCSLAANTNKPSSLELDGRSTEELEEKRNVAREYYNSLIATLEQKYGKLERDESPDSNPWVRYKTIDQYGRRGDTYLHVELYVSPDRQNNQATEDYDYLDIEIYQNLAMAAKPLIINQ